MYMFKIGLETAYYSDSSFAVFKRDLCNFLQVVIEMHFYYDEFEPEK